MVLHFAALICSVVLSVPLIVQAASGDESESGASSPSARKRRRKVAIKRLIGPLHAASDTGKIVRETFENYLKYGRDNLPPDKFAISPYSKERSKEDWDRLDEWRKNRGLEPTHLTDDRWYTQTTVTSSIKQIAEAVLHEHLRKVNIDRVNRSAATPSATAASSPSRTPTPSKRKATFISPSSDSKSTTNTSPTMNLGSKMKGMSLAEEDTPVPVKACCAVIQGRKKGDDDGSGETEYYSIFHRMAPCKLVESDGVTKCGGIAVCLPGFAGVPISRYHFSVTRPDNKGRQWLQFIFKDKDSGLQELPLPFRDQSAIPDAWQDKVLNTDFHAIYNNAVEQFNYHHVLPRNSSNRDTFADVVDRLKDNTVIHEILLPCQCETTIMKYGLAHTTLDKIVLSSNPSMIRTYHEKYHEITTEANKKSFLKLVGMYGSIVVILRQVDLDNDRKQAAEGLGRVDASPTAAAAAANNDFDQFM